MTADAPSKRRWFRFSLRTFLVAFTAVAVWLGWNVHLVQRRKDFIASLPAPCVAIPKSEPAADSKTRRFAETVWEFAAKFVFQDRRPKPTHFLHNEVGFVPHNTVGPTSAGLPWIRTLLGDQPYLYIAYFPGPSIESAAELFPEATLLCAKQPWPWPDIRVIKTETGWMQVLIGD